MREKEEERYMNLKTDFAFKTVFANANDKSLTISFLNAVLKERGAVTDVTFLPLEQLGQRKKDRRGVFDIHCKNQKEEMFVIEMQIAKQKYFMDRCLFYSSFLIQKQAKKGKWDYCLEPVYMISVLDFNQWDADVPCVSTHYMMNGETGRKSSDKLRFITIELPKFNKKLEDAKTALDYWLFFLKDLSKLKEQPAAIKGTVFEKLFEAAEINKLTDTDMETYKKRLREYNDIQLMLDYKLEEGMELGMQRGIKRGMEQGMQRGVTLTAKNLLNIGIPIADIAKATGLTPKQINRL
jgi:predicted transposase/invertase (TIGR01784 family)